MKEHGTSTGGDAVEDDELDELVSVTEAGETTPEDQKNAQLDDNSHLDHLVERVKIKGGIDINKLCSGGEAIFEVDQEAIENTREEFKEEFDRANKTSYGQAFFENKELLDELKYDGMGGYGLCLGDEDYDCLDGFEEVEKKMSIMVTADGGVKKRVKRPGSGEMVTSGAQVHIHYNGYLEHADEPFDSTRLRNKKHILNLGKGSTIPGLELGLLMMKKGEIASFLIQHEYAWGEMGCPPRIPEKAAVLFEVELLHFHDEAVIEEFDNLESPQDRINFAKVFPAASARKKEGNAHYIASRYKKAMTCYKIAAEDLRNCNLANEEEEKQQQDLLFTLYKNLSLISIKSKLYHKAIKYGNLAVKSGKDDEHKFDAKCNYFLGKANRLLGEYKLAELYLTKAIKVKRGDKNIQEELTSLNKDKERHRMLEKLQAQRMFNPKDQQSSEEEAKAAESLPWLTDPETMELYTKHLETFFEDDENQKYKVPKDRILTEKDVKIWEEAARRLSLFVTEYPTPEQSRMRISRTQS